MNEASDEFLKEAPMPVQRRGATYMTVSELAKKLDVHRNSIIYWIKTGKINAHRSGLAEKSPFIIPIEEADRVIEGFSNGLPQ